MGHKTQNQSVKSLLAFIININLKWSGNELLHIRTCNTSFPRHQSAFSEKLENHLCN